MEEQQIIRISVRNLVEFILREGDIDNRISGGMDRNAMQLGSRIHRKIQRSMGSAYRAEVPLKIQIPLDGFVLQIEGRADGIMDDENGVTIDEIKGVMRDLAHITRPIGVHLAQARCYAYIYYSQEYADRLTPDMSLDVPLNVQMTYCQMETEEIKKFVELQDYEELKNWFFDVIHQYEKWAKFQIEWKSRRNESIKRLVFPFAYREGQKDLAAAVYRTILRKKQLFVQAPTGVGKTMAAIFPALKAVGEELGDKIFYLTAKTITRTVAEQAFQTLKKQGLDLKTITLTAKDKICFCDETACNPDECPFAKGHFDRVNEAIYELLTEEDSMDRSAIEKQAQKHQVCPFEMSLDLSEWADAVICDYNYVFDPRAHLKRFFSEGIAGDYLFLIDEAHNLVERGREMYSAVLYKEDVLEVRRLVKDEDYKLYRSLGECNKLLLEMKRECENYEIHNSVSHIALKLMNVMSELERYLEDNRQKEVKQEILDFFFTVRTFLDIHERLDENYVIYTEMESDGRFKLKLYCVNPAVNLRDYLARGNSAVFFSATLLPIHYYKQLLSTNKDDYAIYANSPFPRENRLLLIGTDVSTKYTMRGPQMYERYAEYILRIVEQKKGNYLIFFPSYRFMEEVYENVQECMTAEACEKVTCIMQSQHMGEEAREIFLENFEEDRDGSLLGFCVLGGIFSEGIDLTEDKLIGAIIIGTGLPQVCNDREILKQYFDQKEMRGFDYAYLYPGMNKVLQAAGRVIRTEEDKGVILLLDERFLGRSYQEIFPREWQGFESGNVERLIEKVDTFWKTLD